MKTPICDFVQQYEARKTLRLHMPGHKGRRVLGPEPLDITEIAGADELYRARGIIRESEENAAALFGAGRTLYSAEGSSLCIRAMLYLARLYASVQGRPFRIAAGRNAHKTLMTAAALLDAEIQWLYPAGQDSLISCCLTGLDVDRALENMPVKPAAVFITSPDYLGRMSDIAGIAVACRRHGALLLVDNAHGAYLRFLPDNRHPLAQGADLCCDSAHKTLPVLTGGAYLHVAKGAPMMLMDQAERALALFASTSPSYLILQSLDRANQYLAADYEARAAALEKRMKKLKDRLREYGYALTGDEPFKLALLPKGYGYTGGEMHNILRRENMECEFSDPDHLVMMLTPENSPAELDRLESTLRAVPRRIAIGDAPPPLPRPKRVLSMREALLSPQRWISAEDSLGCVLADASVSCPPAVPILVCGERIDRDAVACFRYYGVRRCSVIE